MRIWQLLLGFTLLLTGCSVPIAPIPVQANNTFLFHRTGGFANAEIRAQIEMEEGHLILARPPLDCQRQLSPSKLQTLENLLADVDFGMLEGTHFPDSQGADLMQYRIEYRNYTVETRDTAIPADLVPIIDYIEALSCDIGQDS